MVSVEKSIVIALDGQMRRSYVRAEKTDESGLTDFTEMLLVEDQPCKLLFGTLTQASGDPVATAGQVVKLFLTPDIEIPAGSRIVVRRSGNLNRTFEYVSSGERESFTIIRRYFSKRRRGSRELGQMRFRGIKAARRED